MFIWNKFRHFQGDIRQLTSSTIEYKYCHFIVHVSSTNNETYWERAESYSHTQHFDKKLNVTIF